MLDARIEETKAGRVRVARLGRGAPLVLLHGYPETLQIFSALAPLLAADHQIYAFDWPGLGGSEAQRGGATPEAQADRLLALLDGWGLERAALAGMDMGGQPALAFAARHPERISALIAMNTLAFGDEETSWEIRVLRRFGWNRLALTHLPRAVFLRAERTFLPRGERLPADLRDELWARFRDPGARAFLVRMCAGYEGSLRRLPELYARIRCPTLVLWGEEDKHFPPAHARRLHQTIAGSRLQLLPGAHHWMAWHAAERVAAAIADFLRGAVTGSLIAGQGPVAP